MTNELAQQFYEMLAPLFPADKPGAAVIVTRAIRHIISLSEALGQIKFYMHPPTEKGLIRSRLMSEISAASKIQIHSLQPYPVFIQSLKQASFILTDGGSIQEEASYLGKPCIILRNTTERDEGIGQNAALTTWTVDGDSRFLLAALKTTGTQTETTNLAASQTILEALHEFRIF